MTNSPEYYMKRAIKLAKKGEGKTSPNPLVGAVLAKHGKIIGKGFHKKAGFPHAEAEAINDAGSNVKGATLYVTLEPCSSFGKTPPCADLIIANGIGKVVIAARDPNPLNRNKGIKVLRKAGVKVKDGILEKEAKEINRVFEKFIKEKTPFVTAKIAQSLDGKIATAGGESKWITGVDSRQLVHKLRSQVDAVIVGANTVLKDDPLLTNRLYKTSKKQPIKIILDSKLKISPNSGIFSRNSSQKVIVATTAASSLSRRKLFNKNGTEVLIVKEKGGKVSLKALLKKLAKMEITHILVEGGGEVLGCFLKENLVDRMLFFISPKIIGGAKAPTSVMGEGIKKLRFAKKLKNLKINRLKEDFLIEGYVK